MRFQNYIFDFGQVIVRFDPEYMTGVYVKDPKNLVFLKDIIFDRLYWDELDAGTMTDDEAKQAFCARLPQDLQPIACKIYDHWLENLPPIPGMIELLQKIKQGGGKLYLLSNISKGFAEKWKDIPQLRELFSLFDGLVFSGPLGIQKPQKAIFDHLLNTYGLQASDCCFIDDILINVEGANCAGITGILFPGNAQELEKLL